MGVLATTFHPCIKTLRRVEEWRILLMYFIDVYFLLMYIWPFFYTNINRIDVYTPIAFPEERYPLYRTRNIYLYIYLLFIDVYLYILMYIWRYLYTNLNIHQFTSIFTKQSNPPANTFSVIHQFCLVRTPHCGFLTTFQTRDTPPRWQLRVVSIKKVEGPTLWTALRLRIGLNYIHFLLYNFSVNPK